jgi:hypothetical protein
MNTNQRPAEFEIIGHSKNYSEMSLDNQLAQSKAIGISPAKYA